MQIPLMPAIRNLVLLSMLVAFAGCSSMPWSDKDAKAKEKEKEVELEPTKLTRFEETVRLERVWSADIGRGLGKKYLRVRPAIAADRIYAADGYGVVQARDRFTGKRVWQTEIGDVGRSFNPFDRRDPSFVTGAVGLAQGLVLIGTTHGEVVALSAADGNEVWRADLGAEVLAAPVGGEDLIFVLTEDGRLLALERGDGAVRWIFENPVPVLTLRGTSTPVFADGLVYAGFASGMVVAIRAKTGEPVWQQRVMLPEGRSELERIVDIDSTPVVSGNVLFVVSYQGRLKAFRANDGTPVWERETSSSLDLAAGFREVFVVDASDNVLAYDQQSAEERWKQEGLARRQLSSPAVVDSYLVVADADGYLHVLAQADGRFVGRRKVDGDGVRSPIVVSDDGLIYVLGNSGSLRAYRIEPR